MMLISKTKPAHKGPAMRPRLMKELLNPMAIPCWVVVRFEVSELTLGISSAVAKIKNLVVCMTVRNESARDMNTNPTTEAKKAVLITAASPQRFVSGPVNTPWVIADTNPTTMKIIPTSSGP